MKITAEMAEAERARWRVVRLDFCTELLGFPVVADPQTGVALMRVSPRVPGSTRTQEFALGAAGLRVLPR